MAEYFSLGRIDPHTAMWMRDAVISDDIPTIADMSDFGRYFPYRFGHAFIAFLSGVYGDDVIVPFFMRTALVGLEQACQDLFGADTKALSDLWIASQKRGYSIWLRDSIDVNIPAPLLSSLRWISRYNQMAPSISPDGKYVIFLSDLNGLSMDLFLAETETGDVLHKIHSSDAGTDIDELQFLESSGTWSPDNRHFAYVGFQHGRNVLITVDVQKPRKKKIISINGLKAFTQPAWSPDGKSILLTGMKNGQVDLYLYTLRNKKLSAITQDAFSEIHPTWSPDGQHIYFASDQHTYPLKNHAFQLVRMSSDGTEKTSIDIFPGANNLNPQVDAAGNIYFL
jgi:Tol biopolymer transport system component